MTNYQIISDETVRNVYLQVSAVPNVDITEPWHAKLRAIRPDHAHLSASKGALILTTSGPVLRKDGTPGEQRGSKEWRSDRFGNETQSAPEWLKQIARDVLGVSL